MALLSVDGQKIRCSSLRNRSERMAGCILRHPLRTGEVTQGRAEEAGMGSMRPRVVADLVFRGVSLARMPAVEGALAQRKWSVEREMKPAAPGFEWRYCGGFRKTGTAREPGLHCWGGCRVVRDGTAHEPVFGPQPAREFGSLSVLEDARSAARRNRDRLVARSCTKDDKAMVFGLRANGRLETKGTVISDKIMAAGTLKRGFR